MPLHSTDPTQPRERISALDSLRGFAIFGILISNIMAFSGVDAPGREWTGVADQTVLNVMLLFVRAKFLSLFAILFGIGFAIQIFRLQQKADHYLSIYARRLLVLFVLGFLHLLMDPAEVLAIYALCGMLLLLFRRFSAKALVCWTLLLMSLPYLQTAIVSTPFWAEAFPESHQASQEAWNAYAEERGVRARAEGDLSDVVAFNWQWTVNRHTASWLGYAWMTIPLPLMLVGLLIGRSRILERIDDELPLLRRTFWLGLGAGIAGTALSLTLTDWAGTLGWNPWVLFAANYCWSLSACVTAIAYGAGFVLLCRRYIENRLFVCLQAVGRLALTNYLLQTLICTALFYNFGFGLFGELGPAFVILTAIAIYLSQILLSVFWVRRFRFGPVEWLWRSLTYGRRQPIRIAETKA